MTPASVIPMVRFLMSSSFVGQLDVRGVKKRG
jgi:hypothetical protein